MFCPKGGENGKSCMRQFFMIGRRIPSLTSMTNFAYTISVFITLYIHYDYD